MHFGSGKHVNEHGFNNTKLANTHMLQQTPLLQTEADVVSSMWSNLSQLSHCSKLKLSTGKGFQSVHLSRILPML